MAQTFTATATAASAEVAENLATAEARSAALETFGADTQFLGVNNVFVRFNDNGTYTATFTTQADSAPVPEPVPADEFGAATAQEQDFIGQALRRADPVDGFATDDEQAAILEAELAAVREAEAQAIFGPAPVDLSAAVDEAELAALREEEGQAILAGFNSTQAVTQAAGATRALTQNAQRQNTLNARVALPQAADWRVRLSLADSANYLYRAPKESLGILAPLARTNGVVFPYTPNIETSYQAKYDAVDLTHSNYRGYFYKNSSVDQINIRGTFTAQDTREAEYLLAVITFFKSVTKMFYGATDPLAGTPPPLVFLSGLGQYQFNNNPCVVSSFNYLLPNDVDYIRANGFNNYGINLDNRRQQSSGPPATGILGAIATVNRLANNFLSPGAIKSNSGAANPVSANNSKTNYTNSTYVPTKMEISVTLLPIQTRSQISQQFNLQKFANGSLLQQGFW